MPWRVCAAEHVTACHTSRSTDPDRRSLPAPSHLPLMRGAYPGEVLRKLPQLVVLADEPRLVGMVSRENPAGQHLCSVRRRLPCAAILALVALLPRAHGHLSTSMQVLATL